MRGVLDRLRARKAASQSGRPGIARGLRAAVVIPSLLALCVVVIHQPQVAGVAVFGTFAHLVMVNYDQGRASRATRAAALTSVGAALITIATLASSSRVAAVIAAVAVGVVFASPLARHRSVAALSVPALLAFMVALVAPADPDALLPRLSGWFLAGIVAQPTLQVFWLRLRPVPDTPRQAAESTDNPVWWVTGAYTGLALGLAVFTTRALDLGHGFWVVLGVVGALNSSMTSSIRRFASEQAGTILGFLTSMTLIAVAGDRQAVYWIALPAVIFVAVYASAAIGVVAGQAGFTLFAVTLFCIIAPVQPGLGRLRVEDVALGGLLSVLLSSFPALYQHIVDNHRRSSW